MTRPAVWCPLVLVACAVEPSRAGDRAAPPPPVSGVAPVTSPGCGPACAVHADAAAALRAALVGARPRVVAFGESHALAGAAPAEPAVRRFLRELLPVLAPSSSALVVEVMLPNPACQARSADVRERQRVVTDRQAPSNQNDYVALASRARELGLEVVPLRPGCQALERIAKAGADAPLVSLEVIRELAAHELVQRVAEGTARGDSRMVLFYGGALHNDVAPLPGREAWVFGPELTAATGGRYLEVDLVVPEWITPSPAWTAQPFYAHYDAARHPGGQVALLTPSPGSRTLVFARGSLP